MPKTTFIATDPSGKVHTRTSESRTYTNVVFVRRSYGHDLALAQRDGSHIRDANNYAYHRAFLDGTSAYLARKSWESEADHSGRIEREVERAKQALMGAASLEEYRVLVRDKAVAAVELKKAEGGYDAWGIDGWTGRPDLATKNANRLAGKPWIAEVLIAEATIKPPKGR